MKPAPNINAEQLANALKKLLQTESAPGVTIHDLRKYTGWGRCKLYRTIGDAVELGILVAEWTSRPSRTTGRVGQAVVYRLADEAQGGASCSTPRTSRKNRGRR